MAVINFCLFLKCSFLILKFSHFLHIHNKVKKSLNLKFSNHIFFFFFIIIIRLQDPRFLFLLLLLLLFLFYFIFYTTIYCIYVYRVFFFCLSFPFVCGYFQTLQSLFKDLNMRSLSITNWCLSLCFKFNYFCSLAKKKKNQLFLFEI